MASRYGEFPVYGRQVEGACLESVVSRGTVLVRNNDGVVMIVRYENMIKRDIRRTCGSVRTSLSAPAKPAMVWWEAAEATSLHQSDEGAAARRPLRLQASKAVGRTGWMKGPIQVNCSRHRQPC